MLESLKKFFNKKQNNGSESNTANATNNSKPTSAFGRQPHTKSNIFASGDQLTIRRREAEEHNAWAREYNREHAYITTAVYTYDPEPLKGTHAGQTIMVQKCDVKTISGPYSTWIQSGWPDSVPLSYNGKPFGVVKKYHVEGLTNIPVKRGSMLKDYPGIPETKLHIKNPRFEEAELEDPNQYTALNAKPTGREFRADYKVDLVGEEKVQNELAALGEGYIWLSVSLGTFEKGEHAGEPRVEFMLDGTPCGNLTPLQSSRYQAYVPTDEPSVCLAKIVQGKKKLEIEALLPSKEAVGVS